MGPARTLSLTEAPHLTLPSSLRLPGLSVWIGDTWQGRHGSHHPSSPHQELLQREKAGNPQEPLQTEALLNYSFNNSPSYLLPPYRNSLRSSQHLFLFLISNNGVTSSTHPHPSLCLPRRLTECHPFSSSVFLKSLQLVHKPSSSLIWTNTSESVLMPEKKST